jgi:hypothetical protein
MEGILKMVLMYFQRNVKNIERSLKSKKNTYFVFKTMYRVGKNNLHKHFTMPYWKERGSFVLSMTV